MVYKVSYVVLGGGHPGAIINQFEEPEVGQHVRIGKKTFEIVEVNELMPARGDFAFLHATVRLLEAKRKKNL
ncbi:MAG: hypothetical protein HY862_03620 [Chloroflexi bacterium]|nr:hypothetical protein [Chloroflexota bacterium]